jgi:hypothetical protein
MLVGSGSNKGRRLIQPIWCGTGTFTKSGQEPKEHAPEACDRLKQCAPETALNLASGRTSLRAASAPGDRQGVDGASPLR